MRRRLQDVIAAKRRDLIESSIATYAMRFSHVLPADFLHGLSVSRRIRHYSNVVVFRAWLAQILEANASLSKAVSLVQAWCDDLGLPVPDKDTGACSRGRGRLELEFLIAVNERIDTNLTECIRLEDTYHGHIVKSIDGSFMALGRHRGEPGRISPTDQPEARLRIPRHGHHGRAQPLPRRMGALRPG